MKLLKKSDFLKCIRLFLYLDYNILIYDLMKMKMYLMFNCFFLYYIKIKYMFLNNGG